MIVAYRKQWPAWLAGLGLVGACSFESVAPSETDVLITLRNLDQDYGALTTYVMPNAVVDLCQTSNADGPSDVSFAAAGAGGQPAPNEPWRCVPVDHRLDEEVLAAVRQRLDERGYREIEMPSDEAPDFAVFAGIVARSDWVLGRTRPFCDPLPYFSGCWFPSEATPYPLSVGTLVISFADVASAEGGDYASVWTMAAQQLLSRSQDPVDAAEVEATVERAFEQSPYLERGGEQ